MPLEIFGGGLRLTLSPDVFNPFAASYVIDSRCFSSFPDATSVAESFNVLQLSR